MEKAIGTLKKGYIDGGYKFFFLQDKGAKKFDYHYHTFHKCILIEEGEVTYTIEGIDYDLKAGDILWVPSYEAHKVAIKGELEYIRCVVYISEAFLDMLGSKLTRQVQHFGSIIPHRVFHPEELPDLWQESKALSLNYLDNFKDKEELTQLAGFLKFTGDYFDRVRQYILTKDNLKRVQGHKDISRDIKVHDTIIYIAEHLREPLKIEHLAKMSYLSKYHFMRKFKEIVGLSVHQYIIRERLSLARRLMKEGNGLTEIGYEVGFNDYTTFARAFKNIYHMSPRQFMKLNPIHYFGLKE